MSFSVKFRFVIVFKEGKHSKLILYFSFFFAVRVWESIILLIIICSIIAPDILTLVGLFFIGKILLWKIKL